MVEGGWGEWRGRDTKSTTTSTTTTTTTPLGKQQHLENPLIFHVSQPVITTTAKAGRGRAGNLVVGRDRGKEKGKGTEMGGWWDGKDKRGTREEKEYGE
ncbi:hypothetical protein E2C01_079373 [Portunus trituberculatus]|uniref:Uncharacterized protein n=1 Tax=Portunus trituberculatus TaxID=210409 RepID=A0A5B7IVG1_PORTR|nr:hypothetical protein [Portunus trituberculatus]